MKGPTSSANSPRPDTRRDAISTQSVDPSFAILAERTDEWVIIECGGRVVYANRALMDALGAVQISDIVGQPMGAIWPSRSESSDLGAAPSAGLRATLRALDGTALEVEADGVKTLWQGQIARAHLLRLPNQVPAGKGADSQSQRVSAWAQNHPRPVLVYSQEGQLSHANRAANELAQSLGKSSLEELAPAGTASAVQSSLKSGRERGPLESTVVGRTFSWLFFPVLSQQVVHCHVTEITDRQTLEAQLRHSQKLEAIGRLAGGIAHDFNNVLTVVQGHVGLLKTDPGMGENALASLQQISQASERAKQLNNQLLTFSRKSTPQPVCLDLNEILTNISMMLRRTLGEDIDYDFSYASELPSVFADTDMLEQVIMILAVNARDAMPRGGQLVIGTSIEEVDASHAARQPGARPGRFVCLSLMDSGCGMDTITLSRIFEPFFTTKEFGKGTGLGLSVAHSIIQQHQGWMEVRSMVGQGTAFRLFLPEYDGEAVDRPAAESEGGVVPKGTETILVVEDEPPVRWIVRNILERYGYQVLEAGNGVEALAVWHQRHADISLLLTDMVMPVGLSGQELAAKFQVHEPGLKIIYTSGYSAQAAAHDLPLTEGANFLRKPFGADKLARAVRQCLDSRSGG